MTYPTCQAKQRDGQPCGSVVAWLKSPDERERRYCALHARTAPVESVEEIEPAPQDPAADEPRVIEEESGAAAAALLALRKILPPIIQPQRSWTT